VQVNYERHSSLQPLRKVGGDEEAGLDYFLQHTGN
jgi:hypothetical protein